MSLPKNTNTTTFYSKKIILDQIHCTGILELEAIISGGLRLLSPDHVREFQSCQVGVPFNFNSISLFQTVIQMST